MDVQPAATQPPVVPSPTAPPSPAPVSSKVPWLWISLGALVVLVAIVGVMWWMNQNAIVNTESETIKAAEEPIVQPPVEDATLTEETSNPLEVNPFAEEYENPFGEEDTTESDGAYQNPF